VLRVDEGELPALVARAGVAEAAAAAVGTWLDVLVKWNARIDLTAARSAAELVDLMVADAAVLAGALDAGARVVDVGTGAGAPGLGLALLRPDLSVTLVEPLGKRVAFLRTVLGTVKRADVTVVSGRGEAVAVEVERGARAPFDAAMARATLPPPAWLALGGRLVRPGGAVFVLLAQADEPAAAGLTHAATTEYAWPLTGAARRLSRFERV
jgi:16S rRNA (guanine527-N7)-methyltransferase